MTFDDSRAGDEIVKAGDVSILVDAESAQHLNEVRIDYVESLTGAGFSITNPNAKNSCGCGNSFQV
jgi:iron-sulfur cluster assembly accessory protein